MNLTSEMKRHKAYIDKKIADRFNSPRNTLEEAMAYSMQNGGKRLRPTLLLMTLEAFGIPRRKGIDIAIALEMVHTYSLIHDDLPAMDNDDYRRGIPTNHKVYGEAIAILAGDSLLTDAFQVICNAHLKSDIKIKLIQNLSRAAGSKGMIEGQLLDMEAETKKIDSSLLRRIHMLKTGQLIRFAIVSAGMIANQPTKVLKNLDIFSMHLGVAFQIQDDILDVEGDTLQTGKVVGSDVANGKSTYVSLLDLEGAKNELAEELKQALQHLDELPIDTTLLKELTMYVASRDK